MNRQTDTVTDRQETDSDRGRNGQTDTVIDRQETDSDRGRNGQTDTHRDWQSETDRWKNTAAAP